MIPVTDQTRLAKICGAHQVRRLSFFAQEPGKTDVLAELHPHRDCDLEALQRALAELFGQSLQVHTEQTLNPHRRSQVLASAKPFYRSHTPLMLLAGRDRFSAVR